MKAEDFTWQENSSAMYDATVRAAPGFVRPILKKTLLRAIKEKAGGPMVVTEKVFIEALKSSTPGDKLEKIMGEIEKLKTV